MPPVIVNPDSLSRVSVGNQELPDLSDQNFNSDYKSLYPEGLDLKPLSDTHERLLTEVLFRAQESERIMTPRFGLWDEIDDMLRVYIPLSETERVVSDNDPRKPVSIVVPELYAILETILTYNISVFGSGELFRYSGVGPEDVIGTLLMEKTVDIQAKKGKALLELYSQWRDGYAYGIGIVGLKWDVKVAKRTVLDDEGVIDPLTGQFIQTGTVKVDIDDIIFEGTRLFSIDPRKYLPDPMVPIYKVQDGEYVGWKETTNFIRARSDELSPGSSMFNVKYLRGRIRRSGIYIDNVSAANRGFEPQLTSESTQPIDIIWMYIDLIPKEWELGGSDEPEKWLFAVANDEVIVSAHPMGLNHNMFPVGVTAPDFGGHEIMPVSRLELGKGLQTATNFWYNSRMANVRKSLNNMFVVNPKLVQMKTVYNSGPGKVILMRQSAWGKSAKDAVHQLQVTDVTANHMTDLATTRGLMRDLLSAADSVQGVQRISGERVTASEFGSTKGSALSRLQKGALITSLQSMDDLALMFAYHTQQFMSEPTYAKVVGRTQVDLEREYAQGIERGRVLIRPTDLNIMFDVETHDGSTTGEEDTDGWIQLWNMGASHPEVLQAIDFSRVFLHIARILGADNVQDFLRVPEVNGQVTNQGDIQQQLQAGNIIPLEQAGV